MSEMTQEQAQKLAQALRPPTPRSMAIPTRAFEVKYTPDESVLWIANLAKALHTNARLLADVETTHHPDGTLTIRVTPQNA